MKTFNGRIAVITGGASGIGRAIAGCAAERGMKIVLADIEAPALEDAAAQLRAAGAEVLAVRTDVSKAEQVDALAQKTLDAFGAVHLLFNNAGVAAGSTVWESTLADWQWVFGVNLWGVINGVRAFLPIMLRQEEDSHVVNTASIAGLIDGHPCSTYQVAKHAVVALSEHMYFALAQQAKVKVSVLCPGWVQTGIMNSARNRPAELANPEGPPPTPEMLQAVENMAQALRNGLPPEQVAELTFQAIETDQFYILTGSEYDDAIKARFFSIIQRQNPVVF